MKALVFSLAVILTAGLAAEIALIQPKELAARLAAQSTQPTVLHIGPNVLYRSKHIPAAVYAGPASKPEGLELLKQAVDKLPRDGEIILYCGCCPWVKCPNVRPAIALLQQMGFTHAKAIYLETSFANDWIDKGYPVEAGTPKQ